MNPISTYLANKDRKKRSPLGLGSSECSQHSCPPENRTVCRKGPVQQEFDVDFEKIVVSSCQTKFGNSFISWPLGKVFQIIPPDLIGNSLRVLTLKEIIHLFFLVIR
ncbi:hypothetical protein TNCV_2235461 [Trichonephila clavipes]|nr:hypothetical protein TNCV_2235461 [Trichonephila clavipes]